MISILRSQRLVWVACLAVALLAGPSCGSPTGAGGESALVQVGPDDAGQTFLLEAGDRLLIALGDPTSAVAFRWKLSGYPDEALSLSSSNEEAGRFEFVATAAGGGRVELAGSVRCERPLSGYGGGLQCPALGAGQGAGAPRGMPVRLFVVTVRVTGD
jgi:hypothetical protein